MCYLDESRQQTKQYGSLVRDLGNILAKRCKDDGLKALPTGRLRLPQSAALLLLLSRPRMARAGCWVRCLQCILRGCARTEVARVRVHASGERLGQTRACCTLGGARCTGFKPLVSNGAPTRNLMTSLSRRSCSKEPVAQKAEGLVRAPVGVASPSLCGFPELSARNGCACCACVSVCACVGACVAGGSVPGSQPASRLRRRHIQPHRDCLPIHRGRRA